MKDFSLEEFLRYIVIGVFFIIINICIIKTPCEDQFLAWMGKDNIASLLGGALLGLSAVLGVLIYTMYRAFFYQEIINPCVILLNSKTLEKANDLSVYAFIRKTDLNRMDIQNPHVKKHLSEWASQVHLLYNFSLSLIYTFSLSLIFPNQYVSNKWILVCSIIFFVIGYIYHRRYKLFERDSIRVNIARMNLSIIETETASKSTQPQKRKRADLKDVSVTKLPVA